MIGNPDNIGPRDFQGNPQKFVLIPANYEIGAVDAWANQVHFNAPAGFDPGGAETIANSALQPPP